MDYASYADYYQYTQYTAEPTVADTLMGPIVSALSGISLIISLVSIVAMWFLFEKAGESGIVSIIPIYGTWKMYEIVYGSGWKCLLLFVPVLGYVVSWMFYIRLAQAYGKSVLFGIGMLFFPPIFMLILAFGDAKYWGPVSSFI
ncbi:MAG: hypothetical protein IJN57_00135 [Oscillospiraceae bacterium]|nr:hypothetical protein [Oscillospiraceae bacterium]